MVTTSICDAYDNLCEGDLGGNAVNFVAYSPDGKMLASGSDDETV